MDKIRFCWRVRDQLETGVKDPHPSSDSPLRKIYRIHPCIRRTFLYHTVIKVGVCLIHARVWDYLIPENQGNTWGACVFCLGATNTRVSTVLLPFCGTESHTPWKVFNPRLRTSEQRKFCSSRCKLSNLQWISSCFSPTNDWIFLSHRDSKYKQTDSAECCCNEQGNNSPLGNVIGNFSSFHSAALVLRKAAFLVHLVTVSHESLKSTCSLDMSSYSSLLVNKFHEPSPVSRKKDTTNFDIWARDIDDQHSVVSFNAEFNFSRCQPWTSFGVLFQKQRVNNFKRSPFQFWVEKDYLLLYWGQHIGFCSSFSFGLFVQFRRSSRFCFTDLPLTFLFRALAISRGRFFEFSCA